jgi:adenylate kinase family enzyme
MKDFRGDVQRICAARRILVLGSSGSGKTTFALHLGELLGLPIIHLDAHFWQPGWVSTPQDEWRKSVVELAAAPAWIMDGTYERSLDLRIPLAEALIQIDVSRWACLWRIYKRKWTVDDHRRPDAPAGQQLDQAFRRYVWQYPRVTQPFVDDCIRRYGPNKLLVRLRGTREVERFLSALRDNVGREETTA